MNLITVLLALAVEAYLGGVHKQANLGWFARYHAWLGPRLRRTAFWDGAVGVLITLFIPLLLLGLVMYLLVRAHLLPAFVFALVVLIYSLGRNINSLLNDEMDRLIKPEEAGLPGLLDVLPDGDRPARHSEEQVLSAVLIRAHEALFAVICWFFLLGPIGALLCCLVRELITQYADIEGGYADAVRDLQALLMWPSARLYALGFALGGSLVHAFEGWHAVSGHTLDVNGKVITKAGLGALQYTPQSEVGNATCIDWLGETQALIKRTLVVWLIVAGIMTIGGWIA